MNIFLTLFGKIFIKLSRILNFGDGSTWPGHIALKINKNFVKNSLNNSKIKLIIIAGTNGKTTTDRLVTSIIRESGKSYLQNKAGANLLNGLASTIIKGSNLTGKLKQDYLIFEADEFALPHILRETNPNFLIILNIFRDQLDRYGEVTTIAETWRKSFKKLTNETTLILNADDPLVASLSGSLKAKTVFFGLNDENKKEIIKHGADTIYCPHCGEKLDFETVFFSHLGDWNCRSCKNKRPKIDLSKLTHYPLPGTYNKYNCLAAALFAKEEQIDEKIIIKAFKSFTPAFGRGEELKYKGKKIRLFLSKNPTSYNESLETALELGGKNFLFVINDNIPDGLDISWIWDINFSEYLNKDLNVGVSGSRVYDIALRLKYDEQFTHVFEEIEEAIEKMINNLEKDETLYILPNYSAMLEARKIITGKKIL